MKTGAIVYVVGKENLPKDFDMASLEGTSHEVIGNTLAENNIVYNNESVGLSEVEKAWEDE